MSANSNDENEENNENHDPSESDEADDVDEAEDADEAEVEESGEVEESEEEDWMTSSSLSSSQKQPFPQQLVLFLGPHKSGATTVRDFFVRHAANIGDKEGTQNNHYRLRPSFNNWTWPYYPRATDSDAYADLVVSNPHESLQYNTDRRRELLSTLLAVWGHARLDLSHVHDNNILIPNLMNNVIVGNEELARFGSTPFTHRNGISAIETILRLTTQEIDQQQEVVEQEEEVEEENKEEDQDQEEETSVVPTTTFIINYRTPRIHQFLGIWRQLVGRGKHKILYKNWICDSYMTWNIGQQKLYYNLTYEYVESITNPLGLIHELLKLHTKQPKQQNRKNQKHSQSQHPQPYWKIVLIDLQGVNIAQRNISHVIACDILNVPCTKDGWIVGLEAHREIWKEDEHLLSSSSSSSSKAINSNNNKKNTTNIGLPDHGLTQLELDQLEWLFRERDCAYRHLLVKKKNKKQQDDTDNTDTDMDTDDMDDLLLPMVEVLYPSDLWMTCDKTVVDELSGWQELLLDTHFFMYMLQSQFNCAPSQSQQKYDPKLMFKNLIPKSSTTATMMSSSSVSSSSQQQQQEQHHRMTLAEWDRIITHPQYSKLFGGGNEEDGGQSILENDTIISQGIFLLIIISIVLFYVNVLWQRYCRSSSNSSGTTIVPPSSRRYNYNKNDKNKKKNHHHKLPHTTN